MRLTAAILSLSLGLALAGPALAFGLPTKHCSTTVTAGPLRAFTETTSEGSGPARASVTLTLPMTSAEAPGGRLLPAAEADRYLGYAANGEFGFRLTRTKWLTGYAASLVVQDGWSLAGIRLTLPVADLGKADRVAHIIVVVGAERFYFGFRPRLNLSDDAPASVVRPGLTDDGINGDTPKLFAALRKTPLAELQAIDAAGKVLISARFSAERFDALWLEALMSVDWLEASHGTPGCDGEDYDLDDLPN